MQHEKIVLRFLVKYMEILNLDNSYKFEYDNSNRIKIYYGANGIGKTQTAKKIEEYLKKNEEEVLHFSDDIFTDMINENEYKDNSFDIKPKTKNISKLEENIENLKNNLKVKKIFKNLFGTSTQANFSFSEKLVTLLKNDLYDLDNNQDGIINELDIEDIREIISPRKDIIPLITLMNNLEKNNNIEIENFEKCEEISVYTIQQKIIDENNKICPICYQNLSNETIEEIIKSLEKGSLGSNEKEAINYYIKSNYSKTRELIISFLYSKNKTNEIKSVCSKLEKNILYHLNKNIDNKKAKEYINSKQALKDEEIKIESMFLTPKGQVKKVIKEEIEKHSIFKGHNIKIKLKDSKLIIENMPVKYSEMSKSEQKFFKFLYFDILIKQQTKPNNLSIIIDDPFDSYDYNTIQHNIEILSKLISDNSIILKSCDIFSHSTSILDLYKKVFSKKSKDVKISWLDIQKDDKLLKCYSDNYDLLNKLDTNPSDFGLAFKICQFHADPYSLIVGSSILRNHSLISKLLIQNSKDKRLQVTFKKYNSFYHMCCENINHCKSSIKIKNLLKKFNHLYSISQKEITTKTVQDYFSNFNYSDINSIDVIRHKNKKFTIIDKNDVSHIFIFKYFLGLALRRKLEEKSRMYIKKDYIYNELNDLMNEIKSNNVLLYNFYRNNIEILNCFNHSSSRIIPPILIYSTETIQNLHDELDEIM